MAMEKNFDAASKKPRFGRNGKMQMHSRLGRTLFLMQIVMQ
jgi:hypothetical protein